MKANAQEAFNVQISPDCCEDNSYHTFEGVFTSSVWTSRSGIKCLVIPLKNMTKNIVTVSDVGRRSLNLTGLS